MSSLRRHEGYLLIDHRASPGVPGARGLGEGQVFESATITCPHCQRVVILNPDRSRARGYCAACDHYICDGCAAAQATAPIHRPFAAQLDIAEAAAFRAEQAPKSTIWLPSGAAKE